MPSTHAVGYAPCSGTGNQAPTACDVSAGLPLRRGKVLRYMVFHRRLEFALAKRLRQIRAVPGNGWVRAEYLDPLAAHEQEKNLRARLERLYYMRVGSLAVNLHASEEVPSRVTLLVPLQFKFAGIALFWAEQTAAQHLLPRGGTALLGFGHVDVLVPNLPWTGVGPRVHTQALRKGIQRGASIHMDVDIAMFPDGWIRSHYPTHVLRVDLCLEDLDMALASLAAAGLLAPRHGRHTNEEGLYAILGGAALQQRMITLYPLQSRQGFVDVAGLVIDEESTEAALEDLRDPARARSILEEMMGAEAAERRLEKVRHERFRADGFGSSTDEEHRTL